MSDEEMEFNMEVVEELAYAVVGCVYDSNQESVLFTIQQPVSKGRAHVDRHG